MTKEPRITLVIPTRERGDVLQSALRTAIAQDYENLEILVSDNNSSDNTRDVVSSCTHKRVRYCNPGRRLNMSANWDFALSNIGKTDFVSIMGDDDGILPGGIARLAEVLVETGTKALRTKSCDYHWPKRNGKDHGRLLIEKSGGVEIRNGLDWLDKVLTGGLPYANLPVIYNGGVIHIDELRKLNRNGRYFHSAIPDVFSGVALASVVGQYAFLDEPLFVNGASQHSIGTSQFSKTLRTNGSSGKTPAQAFLDEGNIPFHPSLPMAADGSYPKSTRVMVYDAYLQSAIFRQGAELTTQQQQLTQFLASSLASRHTDEIKNWCRKYAEKNGLSYGQARVFAAPIAMARYFRRKYEKSSRNRNVKIFDSPQWPLLTVDEAANFAGDRLTESNAHLAKKVS